MDEHPYRDPSPPPPASFSIANPWRVVFPMIVVAVAFAGLAQEGISQLWMLGIPAFAVGWLLRNRFLRIDVTDRITVVPTAGRSFGLERSDVVRARVIDEGELLAMVPILKPDRPPSLLPQPKPVSGTFRGGWYPCEDGRLAFVLGVGERYLHLEAEPRMFLAPPKFDDFVREVDQRVTKVEGRQPDAPPG